MLISIFTDCFWFSCSLRALIAQFVCLIFFLNWKIIWKRIFIKTKVAFQPLLIISKYCYWLSNVLVTSEKDSRGLPSGWWSVNVIDDGNARIGWAMTWVRAGEDVLCTRCCARDNVTGWWCRPMMTCGNRVMTSENELCVRAIVDLAIFVESVGKWWLCCNIVWRMNITNTN